MDCGTCESATPLQVHKPEVVDVTLTMTEKATNMLEDAFGEDRSHALLVGVLSGGCSGYMYDLQIVESTDTPCQELNINGFRVLVPSASSHLLTVLKSIMSIDSWVEDSRSTIQMLRPRVVVASPSLRAPMGMTRHDAYVLLIQGADCLSFLDGLSTNLVTNACTTVFTDRAAKIIDVCEVLPCGRAGGIDRLSAAQRTDG